jgi:signal transduction histidine kinase/CheY-like chemotaxis protein
MAAPFKHVTSVLERGKDLIANSATAPDEAEHAETAFAQHYAEHLFRFAKLSVCAFAFAGTMLVLNRLINAEGGGESLSTRLGDASNQLSLWLFWAPAIVFFVARDWSRRNFHRVLVAVCALLFFKLAFGISSGVRDVQTVHISMLTLTIYFTMFLGLQFRHTAVPMTLALLSVSSITIYSLGFRDAFAPILSWSLVAALSLFSIRQTEQRDRRLFAGEIQAKALAEKSDGHRRDAERQAKQAVEERERAEKAAADALVAGRQKQVLNDQLTAMHSQRDRLIRYVHHDAAQPIFVLAERILLLSERTREHLQLRWLSDELDVMARSTAELRSLLGGMRDLVSFGDFSPRYEYVSVNELLEHTFTAFSALAKAKGLELHVRALKKDCGIWTDRPAIQRIIGNLVSNAIKYTARGRVMISAAHLRKQRMVRLDVRDSGIGVPKDKQEEIYQETVRLSHQGIGEVQGLGLGLAIVKLLRDKLAGHYLDHYSVLGRGSRFSISVPTADVATALTLQPDDIPVIVPADRTYAVIVEDNESVRRTIVDILRSAGYAIEDNVREAASLSALANHFDNMPNRAPNVVISDYRLARGETARDVIGLVDGRFHWEIVPIIVVTAEIEPDLPLNQRPHIHVMQKSGSNAELIRTIRRAIYEARRDDA